MKQCANPRCRREFKATRRHHIYCSERCRWAVINARYPVRRGKRRRATAQNRPVEACYNGSEPLLQGGVQLPYQPAAPNAVKGTERDSPSRRAIQQVPSG